MFLSFSRGPRQGWPHLSFFLQAAFARSRHSSLPQQGGAPSPVARRDRTKQGNAIAHREQWGIWLMNAFGLTFTQEHAATILLAARPLDTAGIRWLYRFLPLRPRSTCTWASPGEPPSRRSRNPCDTVWPCMRCRTTFRTKDSETCGSRCA